MRYIQRLFVKSAITTAIAASILLPQSAAACNSESYIGTVCSFAMSFCPRGWLPANGQTVPINTNQALYSLLGVRFGGDGRTNFGLPDLQGRAVVGTGSGAGLATVNLGQKIGDPAVNVVVPLPLHNHAATFSPTTGSTVVTVPEKTGTGLTVSGQTITNTLNLTAATSGLLKIAGGSAVAGSASLPTNGAILAKPALGAPNIYNPTATADTTLGPSQTLTGPVSGTIDSSISNGTVTGTPTIPSFTVTVPTVTGGSVAVGTAGTSAQPVVRVATQSPSQGLTVCIMAEGLYPDRP
ncbi:UNVERIFIED_ORG: microcystin-dependent protein [Kosakonia oryzae]|uniref:Microcystin-dependent protein n=1 Tax=Kosakonia radicincitans TaxID=283686 RepID=A0AAX2ELY0_9ENTR|nr:phage tail protein [Kosakonia radicincitans]MDP9564981.1 microcystin-dependent protein [Kosakonia oryzae]SFD92183.1 Microcystin-dependent protein [Kosakonia radicincitans]SFQ97476.1 Microcystin-dependent protein [Kosakonia radicincitans]SFT40131.1 Microcystin-dependent protein [Kosakonia radicincitans]SFX09528.1 Microcystin-dependent protein [Kosakonia radicincitans]